MHYDFQKQKGKEFIWVRFELPIPSNIKWLVIILTTYKAQTSFLMTYTQVTQLMLLTIK